MYSNLGLFIRKTNTDWYNEHGLVQASTVALSMMRATASFSVRQQWRRRYLITLIHLELGQGCRINTKLLTLYHWNICASKWRPCLCIVAVVILWLFVFIYLFFFSGKWMDMAHSLCQNIRLNRLRTKFSFVQLTRLPRPKGEKGNVLKCRVNV